MLVAPDGRLERYPGHVRLPAWLTNSIFIFRAAQNWTVLRGVNEMRPFLVLRCVKPRNSADPEKSTRVRCFSVIGKLPKLNLP